MGHDHNHHIGQHNKAFAIGIILNVGYVIVEFSYGLIYNSMALIADAGHNLSDVLGLMLAWGATRLAAKSPSKTMTYGYRKSTILAALSSPALQYSPRTPSISTHDSPSAPRPPSRYPRSARKGSARKVSPRRSAFATRASGIA